MTIRFDDVCINSDMQLLQQMTDFLFDEIKPERVIYGISPLVHKMQTGDKIKDQRIFPEILNAMSDYRNFYKVELAGIPEIDKRVVRAGHGLIHVDHRLLTKDVQELSIVSSCSLVGADTFIPPFNKWNSDTDDICHNHGINLIRFEDGWRSMEHNTFTNEPWWCIKYRRPVFQSDKNQQWYLHAREWTFEKFVAWFR